MGKGQGCKGQDRLRTRTILVQTSTGRCGHHLGNFRTINDSISTIVSQLPIEKCCPNLSTARHPHRCYRRIWYCKHIGHRHLGRHHRATWKSGGCKTLSPQYRGLFNGFRCQLDADAWITWPEWAVDNPKVLQEIPISSNRSIWRDLNIALSSSADLQASSFIQFLISDAAQKLMRSAGYVR